MDEINPATSIWSKEAIVSIEYSAEFILKCIPTLDRIFHEEGFARRNPSILIAFAQMALENLNGDLSAVCLGSIETHLSDLDMTIGTFREVVEHHLNRSNL